MLTQVVRHVMLTRTHADAEAAGAAPAGLHPFVSPCRLCSSFLQQAQRLWRKTRSRGLVASVLWSSDYAMYRCPMAKPASLSVSAEHFARPRHRRVAWQWMSPTFKTSPRTGSLTSVPPRPRKTASHVRFGGTRRASGHPSPRSLPFPLCSLGVESGETEEGRRGERGREGSHSRAALVGW